MTEPKRIGLAEIETNVSPSEESRAIVVALWEHTIEIRPLTPTSASTLVHYEITVTGFCRFQGSSHRMRSRVQAWERFNRTVAAITGLTDDGFDLMRGADE
jgi:hypothetical protein